MELTNLSNDRKLRRKSPVDVSTIMYGKVPPQARELEEAVLGAIMLEKSAFDGCDIEFTNERDVLREANFFIVAVPTPVDEHNIPDLLAKVRELLETRKRAA